MTIKPDISESTAKSPEITLNSTTKREIYPQIDNRLKTAVFWLGLAFVVIVFFFQNVSGYS